MRHVEDDLNRLELRKIMDGINTLCIVDDRSEMFNETLSFAFHNLGILRLP